MHTPATVLSKDGTRIACWRQGTGPPLLLVHGGLCDHLAWYFVGPLLAQRFSVWSYDRRAHGQSGDTPPYAAEREVDDLQAVLREIGEPAHLLGHSAGALVALRSAPRIEKLRSLIVYEPPCIVQGTRERPSPDLLRQIEGLLAAGDPDEALRLAMRETVSLSDAEIDAMQTQPGWEHLRDAARAIPHDWAIWEAQLDLASLNEVSAPALVMVGSRTLPWLRAGSLAVLEALPSARLAELEGQGHSAMVTAPELFAGVVERFAGATY